MSGRAPVTFAATLALAATLAPAATPPAAAPVLRVGVDLIRIDATVTDERGKPLADVRPEDFRLKIDGRPVPVENAAFFGGNAAADGGITATGGVGPRGGTGVVPGSDSDRSIVFLIDDLHLSPDGVAWTRDALEAFAADWDSLDATVGVRFTSDEGDAVLLSRRRGRFDSAIGRFRYRPPNELNPFQEHTTFRRRIYSILTTLNALRSAPGRKSVILVSDGLDVGSVEDPLGKSGIGSAFDALFEDRNADAALRTIVEVANRASTVVHTVRPRGPVASWPRGWAGAPENTSRATTELTRPLAPPEPLAPNAFERIDEMEVRQGLRSLAADTGGLAFYRRNGIERSLLEIAEDQRSYYLIGFQPPEATFSRSGNRASFRRIELTVDRPGVRVRTRAGFYGVTDDELLRQAPLSAPVRRPAP